MKTKVLVTGATGFIGNHVINLLLKRGCDVIATSTNIENARQKDWFSKVTFVPFSTSEKRSELFNYFGKPDSIIHLAWERLPNYEELFHIEKNLPENYYFIKQLVTEGAKDITVIGTCFEYGMQEGCLREDIRCEPANPYAVAKDTLRRFLDELKKKHEFHLKWIRLFYMYGQGQSKTSLISQLEEAIIAKAESFKMSGGEQIRDYLPVETVVSYLCKIALQKDITGIINCCSGQPISVRKLVEDYIKSRNSNISLDLGYYPYPNYEPFIFWGDNSKLKTILEYDIYR